MARLPFAETAILISGGQVEVTQGKARSILVSELEELANSTGTAFACIRATSVGDSGFKLSLFGIPEELHQRFRNVWAAN